MVRVGSFNSVDKGSPIGVAKSVILEVADDTSDIAESSLLEVTDASSLEEKERWLIPVDSSVEEGEGSFIAVTDGSAVAVASGFFVEVTKGSTIVLNEGPLVPEGGGSWVKDVSSVMLLAVGEIKNLE